VTPEAAATLSLLYAPKPFAIVELHNRLTRFSVQIDHLQRGAKRWNRV